MNRLASIALLSTALAIALIPLPGRTAEVAGVKVADTARVNDQELVLNGAGMRSKAVFKIYVAALYLPQKTNTAAAVLALSGAKRVSMTTVRDITARQLTNALTEGIRYNHTPAEVEKLRARMEALGKIMADIGAARSGCLITIDFIPGAGTQIGIDGQQRGAPIPGEDFYRALLRIWLGETVVDASLQKALLGQGS